MRMLRDERVLCSNNNICIRRIGLSTLRATSIQYTRRTGGLGQPCIHEIGGTVVSVQTSSIPNINNCYEIFKYNVQSSLFFCSHRLLCSSLSSFRPISFRKGLHRMILQIGGSRNGLDADTSRSVQPRNAAANKSSGEWAVRRKNSCLWPSGGEENTTHTHADLLALSTQQQTMYISN